MDAANPPGKGKNMLKYDNCKNCVSSCEHAGKDREFVCRNGISCKVLYSPDQTRKAASDFVEAIKRLAENPQNLENLQNYLEQHFTLWLERYANTPENMAAEMLSFANIEQAETV